MKKLLIGIAIALPLMAAGVFYSSLRMKQIATPANPSAGENKLYFKSDDKLYKLTSAGTETEIGAGGGGTAACDASTVGSVCLREDFLGGGTTTGSPVGNGAFRNVAMGSGGVQYQTGQQDHVGILEIFNNSATGSGIWLGAAASGGNGTAKMVNWYDLYNKDWEIVWVAKVTTTANIRFRAGFDNYMSYGGAVNSASMWIRYDTVSPYSDNSKASGAGAFVAQICGYDDANCAGDASGLTATLAGTVDTNWHKFRIYRTAGKINFQVDAGATKTACLSGGGCDMTLPANPGYGLSTYGTAPALIFTAEASGAKSAYVDYAGFQMTGLTR